MKNKRDIITFILIFILAIISTIFFLKPHYSIDTIEFLTNGYKSYINSKFLVDGRIFSAILLKIVIDFPMKYVLPISYILGILISCFSVMVVRKWIIKKINSESKRNIFPTIIAYVIIFNFMYIDIIQFVEFPIIALSNLLFIISAQILVEKKKKYILKSGLLVLIAMFCYQGTINVFISTVFILSIIENKKINKTVILDILKMIVLLSFALITNYIFTEIVGGTSRINFNIIDNIKNTLIDLILIIFNSGKHYPAFLQLIIILIITTYCLIKKYSIINLIYIYVVCVCSNIIVLLITAESPAMVISQNGRIFISVGSIIGYMFMYIWCCYEEIKEYKFIKTIAIIYFITLLITYIQYTYMYMQGQWIDEYIIHNIDKVISEYENQTGNTITKYTYTISFDNYQKLESHIILKKQYTERNCLTIQKARMSTAGITDVLFWEYANRKIERIFLEENWKEKYFKNIDFSELELFDNKRFVFEGDTVYIVL